jgi:hypothetical protein
VYISDRRDRFHQLVRLLAPFLSWAETESYTDAQNILQSNPFSQVEAVAAVSVYFREVPHTVPIDELSLKLFHAPRLDLQSRTVETFFGRRQIQRFFVFIIKC